jgi:hypothetical protein
MKHAAENVLLCCVLQAYSWRRAFTRQAGDGECCTLAAVQASCSMQCLASKHQQHTLDGMQTWQ